MARTLTMSELMDLPVSFSLEKAGQAFGLGRTKSYELAQRNEFPCPVRQLGCRLKVTKPDLFRALGLELAAAGQQEPATADAA